MDVDGTLGLHRSRSAPGRGTGGDARLSAGAGGDRRHSSDGPEHDVARFARRAAAAPAESRGFVQVLVGEAFNRLDPTAQEVMQALAVYGAPVPAVAVDYLLQPYRVGIDSARVLGRLVGMQFVRGEAGRYYLHQVDRDYALSRIPQGEPEDRTTEPPPFTRYALRHRAAEYFKETRKPREAWKTLDDLAPQLAEFDLRLVASEGNNAASVLSEIDFDHLFLVGPLPFGVGSVRKVTRKADRPRPRIGKHEGLGNCL